MNRYIASILKDSEKNLKKVFTESQLSQFTHNLSKIPELEPVETVPLFNLHYYNYIKTLRQTSYKYNTELDVFITRPHDKVRILWGDCYNALKQMKNESIQLVVTSPPYYNAREYSQWETLKDYFIDMKNILLELYRVLDNYRTIVWNVSDIIGNDNELTKSTWGNRRIPLGAYFITLFEECGFTFIDDIIWDKMEVQSNRHKNGGNPYPLYQYPINSYEHLLIFQKHELDETLYPCPICGNILSRANAYSKPHIKSWECSHKKCPAKSPSQRGKRYSARSHCMNLLKTPQNIIEKEFLMNWRRDIVQFPAVKKINNKGENILGHTAPFPIDIPQFAIKMYSGVGEKVLDPFAGSFTSAISAYNLNRIAIGIELNKDMFSESIIKNLTKHEVPYSDLQII